MRYGALIFNIKHEYNYQFLKVHKKCHNPMRYRAVTISYILQKILKEYTN